MKTVIAFFCILSILASIVRSQSIQDLLRLRASSQLCMRQTGVNQNVVNRARQGEIVNDPQFDCFAACLLGQIGLTNNDGSLNANVAAAKVPFNYPNRDSIVNAIYYCSNQRGYDKCSTAHQLFVCIRQNNVPTTLFG